MYTCPANKSGLAHYWEINMNERSKVALLFAGFWLLYGAIEHNMTPAFLLVGLVFLVWIFFEIKEVSDARENSELPNAPKNSENQKQVNNRGVSEAE